MKEGEGRIEIKDFPHEVIEACLRFMYSGRLSVQRRLLVEVAAFRDKYAIDHLRPPTTLIRRKLRDLMLGQLLLPMLLVAGVGGVSIGG